MIVNDTFIKAKEDFVAMQSNPHTKRAYANDISHWEQFVQHIIEDAPTNSVAIAFKTALEDRYAPSTAQRIWCTVASFYGWMKGTGRCEATPFHGVKSPKRPSEQPPAVPTDTEITKLLRACRDGTKIGQRSELIIQLLLNGLRAEEVCNAKQNALYYDKYAESWMLSVLGKGNKYRTIPINSACQQAIYEYFMNTPSYSFSEHLVTNSKGEQMNTQMVYRAVRIYARKAGIEDMHPHALRHHYATRLSKSGVDVFVLQKLLGHERADTTQRYIALNNDDIAKALEKDPMHNAFETHNDLYQLMGVNF